MRRLPRPPSPEPVLERLLRRLREEARAVRVGPDLGRRVERAIRRKTDASGHGGRTLPAWIAVAAGVAMALGAGFRSPAALRADTAPTAAPPGRANPLEARRRYDVARRLPNTPFAAKRAAYDAVLLAAHETDPIRRRTLLALAGLCRRNGRTHGAAAFEAAAARLGAERDPGRLAALLRAASALRREGDLEAAEPHLEALVESARRVSPRLADQGRRYLAEDLHEQRRRDDLERLLQRMEREHAGPHVRVAAYDALGGLHLEAGEADRAREALRGAERAYREGLAQDEEEAARCAKAWLRMHLPAALARAP